MILRLVDRRAQAVLETWPSDVRTIAAAGNIVRKRANRLVSWTRHLGYLAVDPGDSGPKLHVQAELLDGGVACARWVYMETRSYTEYLASDDQVVERELVGRQMRWVRVGLELSDHLAGACAPATEVAGG